MTTLKNTTGTQAVNITTDGTAKVIAMHVQIQQGEHDLLEFKTFATEKIAKTWAAKKLA